MDNTTPETPETPLAEAPETTEAPENSIDVFKRRSLEFIDSIQSSFSYINANTIENIKKFVNDSDEILMKDTATVLYKYAINITDVTAKQKLKNNDFKFMNGIVLFNGMLHLDKFKSENKSTKKVLTIHLNNLLASSIHTVDLSIENMDIKGISETIENNTVLSNLVNTLTNKLTSGNVDIPSLLTSLLTNPEGAKDNPAFKEIFDVVEKDIQKIDPDSLQDMTSDLMKMLKMKK